MRIVVPLDYSAFSETAIPHALGLLNGGVLALVTCLDPKAGSQDGVAQSAAGARSIGAKYLEEVAGLLPESTQVETHVLALPVSEAVSAFAEKFDADLIVMSTHGRGPVSRFWLGSAADRLTRVSPVPLFLVRPNGEVKSRPPLDVPIGAPDKVLVPLDGSTFGEAAIQAATQLAAADAQTLHLLQVAQYPFFPASGYMPDTIDSNKEIAAENLSRAESYLDSVRARLESEGRKVMTGVVSAEFIAPAILEYADSWGAYVIALSTHGRSGLTRMALGSVADKVVRQSQTPVLLVRASDL